GRDRLEVGRRLARGGLLRGVRFVASHVIKPPLRRTGGTGTRAPRRQSVRVPSATRGCATGRAGGGGTTGRPSRRRGRAGWRGWPAGCAAAGSAAAGRPSRRRRPTRGRG